MNKPKSKYGIAREHAEIAIVSYMGGVIKRMAEFDFLMRRIIALHVARKGQYTTLMFILDKLNFEKNYQVFLEIIADCDFFESKKELKTFTEDVRKIQDLRNTFAHSLTEIPVSFSGNKDMEYFNFIRSGKMNKQKEFATEKHTMEQAEQNKDIANRMQKIIRSLHVYFEKQQKAKN